MRERGTKQSGAAQPGATVNLRAENGIVMVDGDLTIATATQALRQVESLLATAGESIVFDFANLQRADSAALALLLETIRRAGVAGKKLAYRNIPDRLHQLARICELDEIIATAR